MAVIRSRRVRDAGMGGLVQQPAALGAHRQHPAGRSRGTLLRHAGTTCHGGVTQTKWPPTNPGRFSRRTSDILSGADPALSSKCIWPLLIARRPAVERPVRELHREHYEVQAPRERYILDAQWPQHRALERRPLEDVCSRPE